MCVYKQNRLDLRPLFLMSKVSKVVFVTVYRVSEVLKVVIAAVYRVMLLMSEVLKVNSFIYYVLHCMNKTSKGMSKVSKETQNTQ